MRALRVKGNGLINGIPLHGFDLTQAICPVLTA